MITKRTLESWRKKSLTRFEYLKGWDNSHENTQELRELHGKILSLTQELMDVQLLEKAKFEELKKLDAVAQELSYMKEVRTENTGGHVMADVILLKDGGVVVISEEAVAFYQDENAYNNGEYSKSFYYSEE